MGLDGRPRPAGMVLNLKRRAVVWGLGGLLFFVTAAPVYAVDRNGPSSRVAREAARLEQEFGFRIYWKEIPFPSEEKLAFVPADPADYPALAAFMSLLRGELEKYPPDLFRRTRLQAVVLLTRQFHQTTPLEGLYRPEWNMIFLDFKRSQGHPDVQRHNIHHELFHMIEVRGGGLGLRGDWEQANPPDFEYRPERELRPGHNPYNYYAPSRPGFATDYAMTAPEEDRAEIFAALMVPAQNRLLRQWCRKDPYLREKVNRLQKAVIEFCPDMKKVFASMAGEAGKKY